MAALPRFALAGSTVLAMILGYAGCSGEGDEGDKTTTGNVNAGKTGKGGTNGGGGSTSGGGATGAGATGAGATSSGKGGGVQIDAGATDPDAFWATDPPPPVCQGGSQPPVPGGTPECPDDKNREGCSCTTPGATAPCWPGLRKNRNRGQCRDGTTVCQASGEVAAKWGGCNGFVLPEPNATTGAQACLCFTSGYWNIENLSPCFLSDETKKVVQATSKCPSGNFTLPAPKPSEPWSKSTLKVDCAGKFKLCYTLRAGDGAAPKASDCVIQKLCLDVVYEKANVEQQLPVLEAWATDSPEENACATQFASIGGYGEMSVVGESAECDQIPDKVFNVVKYCPLACAKDASLPGCDKCKAGQGGAF